MILKGLHLLLTYSCTLECDHCFAWGSPWQSGVMTLDDLELFLDQARELGTVESIYFEGGEPFLYYPIMLAGAQMAVRKGFKTGLLTNTYWATEVKDAVEWLRPFAGVIQDLSISSDLYHWSEELSRQAEVAQAAARELGIPIGVISVAQPEAMDAARSVGQLPTGDSAVMYRGRAAQVLAPKARMEDWSQFTECPYEDLREPGRIHLDPFGNMHICQGISLGNVFETSMSRICSSYDPEDHPITGPLLEGGPAALVERYGLEHEPGYADACHLCYKARRSLRGRFPEYLTPDQMYGVPNT